MDGATIDRLISGAGAVAAGADDWARGFSESEPRLLGRRPPAVAVAIVMFALAGLFLLVGIETSIPPVASGLRAGDLARDDALGQRTYATVAGSLASTYLETFADRNGNDVQDPGETGDAWIYLLVDPAERRGITVRSARPPSAVFTSRLRGVVTDDPAYVRDDLEHFKQETDDLGLTLEPNVYVDASDPAGASPQPLDLAAEPPADGTLVEISGSRLVDWIPVCPGDANGDGTCQDDEADGFDVIVYDPVGKRAITVFTPTSPAFTPVTLSGMLTRNERAVQEAGASGAVDFADYHVQVSPHYVLGDGTTPPDALVAFVLAAAVAALGGVILVGSVGGYLAFGRAGGPLPEPVSTLGPGERRPLRVTGFIRTPYGRVHVREAPADLVRFVLRPEVPATEEGQPGQPATTTLLIERTGYPQGVSLGLGELVRLSRGEVTPLRGPRPALRAVAGTGPLLLSFDSAVDRDRAAAELLDESGFRTDGRPAAMHGPTPAMA